MGSASLCSSIDSLTRLSIIYDHCKQKTIKKSYKDNAHHTIHKSPPQILENSLSMTLKHEH